MKNFKKIMALIIAAVMIVGTMSVTALADPAQGAATAETSVTISGLDSGDVVKLYKVIGWSDSTGWVLEDDFASVTAFDGKLGVNNQAISIDTGVVDEINSQISSSTDTAAEYTMKDSDNGSHTFADLATGLYIAIVTASQPGVVYNPIIVSADYVANGNSIDASNSSIPNSTGGAAVAKKSKIELSKEAANTEDHDGHDDETVKVGDTLTFTVETEIPPFAGYQDPSFVLTDEMSNGLKFIQTGGTKDGITILEPADAVFTVSDKSDTGYKITLDPDYLKTIATNTKFKYTYQATVTTDAVDSVNHENNTLTLEFSNNPNDGSSKTRLRDRTNHYTFTIDGNLLGSDNYSATEVVKIGVSADGSEIIETVRLANGGEVGALENAEFALYAVTDEEFANAANFNAASHTAYSNKDSAGETVSYANIKSGADGRINIQGIDGGKYLLVETKAPTGYIKRQTPVQIEIIPTIDEKVEYEEDADGVKVKVTTKELTSYVVKIDGVTTATYTITNSADKTATVSDEGDKVGSTNVGDDTSSGKIKNTKGVELPSTGGMGTTLFYIIGAILVVGAGILLVTRRRMSAK